MERCSASWRSLSHWLPHRDSAFLIFGDAQDLMFAEDGCGTFVRSSGLYFEGHFLIPVEISQPTGTDPSSTGTDFLASQP